MNERRVPKALVAIALGLLGLAAGCAGASTPTSASPGDQASTGVISGQTPSLPKAGQATGPSTQSAALGLPLAAVQLAGSSQQVGIWVNGEGRVTATPDIAVMSLGVESRASTVDAANSQAAQAMSAVVEALKAKGVKDSDIRTQFFNIAPEYQYKEREAPKVTGYRVTNTVQAKFRDISKLGPAIDSVVKAGGDVARIQGIRFDVENPTPLLKQARDKAMEDAKAKAAQLASLGGVGLGRPIFISESGGVPSPLRQEVRALAAAASAPETPISPGEMQFQANVQVVYAIQ